MFTCIKVIFVGVGNFFSMLLCMYIRHRLITEANEKDCRGALHLFIFSDRLSPVMLECTNVDARKKHHMTLAA